MLWSRDSSQGPPHQEAGDCDAVNTAGAGRPLSFDQGHCAIMYSLLMSFNLYLDETAVGKSIIIHRHLHPWRPPAGGGAVHSIAADICRPCHRTHKLPYDLIPLGWNGSL
jgi:hypothetical protein